MEGKEQKEERGREELGEEKEGRHRKRNRRGGEEIKS